MAFTSGIRAGECAAAYASGTRAPEVPRRDLDAVRERLLAPLARRGELDWREYEDALQRIVTEGLGPVRSAAGLARCRELLSALEGWEGRVGVNTGHDLCRLREVSNLRTVACCTAAAAEYRRESRFGSSHRRSDYPDTDDGRWLGQVLVRRSADGPAPSFLPLPA
jgi:succinate dehydrogenase/fumarate reductase flavoprotein subunit